MLEVLEFALTSSYLEKDRDLITSDEENAMANLNSRYLGVELSNPLVVGACSLTSQLDTLKRIEDSGAGAVVIKSLFEEQIQLKRFLLDEALHRHDDWHAEMTSIFPDLEDAGPEEHLLWVRKAKEALEIPVFASLNAVNPETWLEFAVLLEGTGVDGIELNFFATPSDAGKSGTDIENEQIEIATELKKRLKIPIAAKLSPFYTNPLNFVRRLDAVGTDGFVLFNRLFDPSLDPELEKSDFPFNLSNPNDHRQSLRYVGLLSGKVRGTLCASHGIHSPANAVEVLLAGADAFQTVSYLYRNSVGSIKHFLNDIASWMDRKGYASIADFKGKLDAERNPDKFTYRRAQYVRILMRPQSFLAKPSSV